MLKTSKKLLIFSLTSFLVFPLVALAGIDFSQPGKNLDITKAIENIFNFIWPLFTTVAAIMFLVAGYLFLTANGEPGKIKLAKDALLWGIIGVIVGILAFSVPTIVKNVLGV